MFGNSTAYKPAGNPAFPGRIAIIVNPASVSKDLFHSADRLLEKYGTEKILRITWPEDFVTERKKLIATIVDLAEEKDIKILILNQAMPGSMEAIDKLRETRDDIFIILCSIHEPESEIALRADLIFRPNEPGMGLAMVKQAKKQGAKVFVHYSFPRHMAKAAWLNKKKVINDTCEAEGMQFVDVTALDPMGVEGVEGAGRFIIEDVSRQVANFGENTAFFCTNCQLQKSLIKAVIDNRAIYPQSCCPSPYHGFPEALDIKSDGGQNDLNFVISEASRIAAEKNMSDRLSTWPVSASMMFANAGAEYAILWLNGKVDRDHLDDRVLEDCMNAYIKEEVGEGVKVEMSSFEENGTVYNNLKLVLMSYLDL